MPETSTSGRLDDLILVAEGQSGYFTTDQARSMDITAPALHRLERRDFIEREHWGVYRLSKWPRPPRSHLWPIYLWCASRSPVFAFSHRTALQLHDVSDVDAPKVDVTFSQAVRWRGSKPAMLAPHVRHLAEPDTVKVDGLLVTSLRRTLLDLILDGVARDAVAAVLAAGPNDKLRDPDYGDVLRFYDLPKPILDFIVKNSDNGKRPRAKST